MPIYTIHHALGKDQDSPASRDHSARTSPENQKKNKLTPQNDPVVPCSLIKPLSPAPIPYSFRDLFRALKPLHTAFIRRRENISRRLGKEPRARIAGG